MSDIQHLLEGMNPEQVQSISHKDGPLLVLAGPGSGKTRVLTFRIAALMEQGVPASQIVALTFTNKAAAEMRDRLSKLVEGAVPWAGTFHAACARILRPNAERVGLNSSFSIAAADDSKKILRDVSRKAGFQLEPSELRQLASAMSHAKNRGLPLDEVQCEATGISTADILFKYQSEMRRLGQVDFDDLLLLTRQLLRDHTDVREAMCARLRYLLVDEYQDTNGVQFDIMCLLAGAGNICVVGDADQAIYGFRAASAGVVDRFRQTFPGLTEIRLGQNYRSTSSIVSLAASLLAHGKGGKPTIWTDNAEGEKPTFHEFRNDIEEAEFVAGEISELPEGTSCAVLMRTNAQSRVLEEALRGVGIKYGMVGGLKFYDRMEVRDALAWCAAVNNPNDGLALLRAMKAPKRGLGDSAVTTLNEIASTYGLPLRAALVKGVDEGLFSGRHLSAFSGFLADLRTVASNVEKGPEAVLNAVLAAGLMAAHSKGEAGESRKENLEELVRDASRYDSLGDWLEYVALSGMSETDDAAGVQLMTVHAAKGREFPYVWVVGLEEDLFPHGLSTKASEIEEERRLLYVAVTRAEEKLTLSAARSRFKFGQTIPTSISRFVANLPSSVLDKKRAPASARPSMLEYPARPSVAFKGSSYGSYAGAGRRGSYGSSRSKARSGAPSRSRESIKTSSANAAVTKRAAPAGPRLSESDATVGAIVVHGVFGEGKITSADGTKITVKFSDKARVLDITLAPLTLG